MQLTDFLFRVIMVQKEMNVSCYNINAVIFKHQTVQYISDESILLKEFNRLKKL